jgi:hypothetical protein
MRALGRVDAAQELGLGGVAGLLTLRWSKARENLHGLGHTEI